MKRVGHLYEQICNPANVRKAILKASLGKRHRPHVRHVLERIDARAAEIAALLRAKAYVASPYAVRTIRDGATQKERTISKPRFFPDQVIHWALMLPLQPVLMRGMYRYSCGSVPGRGTSDGQKALRRWLNRDYKGTKYCLKMDVTKFYPSIDREQLKAAFRRIVKDADCLWLIDTIIDSSAPGLPIGNYTSQWFANFFLQGLDHYIKQTLGARYYLRYVDDLILLGPNKKALHKARAAIAAYLAEIGLALKPNWQVFPVSARPIDALGLRFYRDYTTLRRRNALRIRRRAKRIGGKAQLNYRDACAVVSYWGWIKRSDSYGFYHKYVRPQVSVAAAKRKASEHGKRSARLRAAGGIRDGRPDGARSAAGPAHA